MTSVTQLGYLGLGVNDVDAWGKFAEEVLGLQVNGKGQDGRLHLRMDEYHHRFTVHPGGNDDLSYVGWEVKDEQSLQALMAQVREAGYEVREGTAEEAKERMVLGLIKFDDPNGIATEAYYGPLVQWQKPFHSPRPISQFVTGQMGLGHIVLDVQNPEESLRFYRDVLRMRISDFIDTLVGPGIPLKMSFFHCNPRHHSLALTRMQGPKRLNHFMIQAKTMDDVGITWDLCKERGIPLALDMGKHSNDHMTSFYMVTPSGFWVEFGTGAREVDDSVWEVQQLDAASIWGHAFVGASPPRAEAAVAERS